MRTQLKIRTEFSFRIAYGPIELVTDFLQRSGCKVAAITDRHSTFGHVQWASHCKAKGIKPIFGVELAFTPDVSVKQKRQELYYLSLLARSNAGLQEIYSAVEEATAYTHYVPRLPLHKLNAFSQDVIVLSGNCGIGKHNDKLPNRVFIEGHPATNSSLLYQPCLPVSDNFMITPDTREVYEIITGRNAFNRPSPMHIMNQFELMNECRYLTMQHFDWANTIGQECDAVLAPATNIKVESHKTLFDMCLDGAIARDLHITGIYSDRLGHELTLIRDKGFTDYFMVIADMVQYAKEHMLVGPARGSSCGSLVCYLLGITDIDPIPHGLIFERFIDVTRSDLPDIDIDFQDDKRDLVFEYLINKYGPDKVARLGTITRYKAKSAINETAAAVKIPRYEAEQIALNIIKRSDGDIRADFCIADTFADSDVGKAYIQKYPTIKVAEKLEAHARHHSTHAAGVVITNEPITHYVSRDTRNNTVHIDKYDAELINLMKVDCLGLRTLTIINDCLQQVGWTPKGLLAHPLDDDRAFQILRTKQWCGIFQFEGQALQNLTRQVAVDRFTDLSALTALARPGPLVSGAAYEWCARRMQLKPTELLHPMMADITADTYGLIVYQEQMLRIIREIGQLSWEDATLFRRGINKKLGMEYFDSTFWDHFRNGSLANGIDETVSRLIWETVNSAGGYAFNKSHSVAYAMVSYWCMILKAHFPLQFALATLRNLSDPMDIKQYLRELDRAGHKFVAYDMTSSEYSWSVQKDVLVGGFINIVGVGPMLARDMHMRRVNDLPYTDRQTRLLENGKTQFDNVFEGRTRFGELLAEPAKFGIKNKLWQIADIDVTAGGYTFIGRVVSWKIRSLNEMQFLVQRNNMKVPDDKWLTLTIEDDSGTINATIPRKYFGRLGEPLTKKYKQDDWFLWRGNVQEGNRRIYVERYKQL